LKLPLGEDPRLCYPGALSEPMFGPGLVSAVDSVLFWRLFVRPWGSSRGGGRPGAWALGSLYLLSTTPTA